jgi:hypothetical protein
MTDHDTPWTGRIVGSLSCGPCIVKTGAENEDMAANQHRSFGSYDRDVPWTVDCIKPVNEDLFARGLSRDRRSDEP